MLDVGCSHYLARSAGLSLIGLRVFGMKGLRALGFRGLGFLEVRLKKDLPGFFKAFYLTSRIP